MENCPNKHEGVQKALEEAVSQNDCAGLKAVLDSGADINCKNDDGNTALHLAIDNDAGYECLKILLENGAGLSFINKHGFKPLHLLNIDSYGTFLSLLKLEQFLDRNVYYGNTILHFLMRFGTDGEFLEQIHEHVEIKLNFDIQNELGQTALHLTASRITGGSELQFILTHYDDIDVTLQDIHGDTFLHRYFKTFEDQVDIEFLNNVLEGKYKCCSGKKLKTILQIRNKNMYTAFHLYFILAIKMRTIKICEKFLEAEADINTCNSRGENILHNLMVYEEEDTEVIRYVIKRGANVNQKNKYLDTPIVTTIVDELIEMFIDCKADLNVQNKVGKTPFMAMLVNGKDEDLLRRFLEHGSNVNATDKFGSSCLHYAAWINADINIIKLLKEFGAVTTEDCNGDLPCIIAEKQGNKAVMDELCRCGIGAHENMTDFDKKFVCNLEELITTKRYSGGALVGVVNVSELLRLPYKGSVLFVDEAKELKHAVIETVNNICKIIAENDALLKNTVILSGSVSENTKVGLPDEFDFCCLIDKISEACEVDTAKSAGDHSFVYLKLKNDYLDSPLRELFDTDCYLESEIIYIRFLTALREALENPSVFNHPNLAFDSDETKEAPMVPNCKFTLKWTGPVYKSINIDIDLVPACQIPNWWPQDSQLVSLLGDRDSLISQGALILLQVTVDEDYNPESKLRVSANKAERMHLTALPQIARDTYMAAKMMISDYVCPTVQLTEDPSFLKKFLTSYMLKCCMFYVLQGDFLEDISSFDYKESDPKTKNEKLHDCVVKVFDKLFECTESETLPTFVFRWQNVFTFQDSSVDNIRDQNKRNCMCRKVYIRLILNLLGQDVDFSDVDTELINNSDRQIDFDFDMQIVSS